MGKKGCCSSCRLRGCCPEKGRVQLGAGNQYRLGEGVGEWHWKKCSRKEVL